MRQITVQVEKSSSSKYDARFVMSATGLDRHQDTIDVEAYGPSLGKKLIALWQHKSDQPFGFWENLRLEGEKLVGDLKTAGTNLGLMVKQLIADEVPLGASIGFMGSGVPNKLGGIHWEELELMECSIVSVPAHPEAMQIAKSFGIDLRSLEEGTSAASGLAASSDAIKKARRAVARANLERRKNANAS